MTLALQGTGVSSGITIGPVHILYRDELEIIEYSLPEYLLEKEIDRFCNALDTAKHNLRNVREQIPAATPPDIAAFIDTHLLMLDDATLTVGPIEIIKSRRCNAEWALKLQRDALVEVFDAMDDPYLRTRRDDVDHVVTSVQRVLLNSPIHHIVKHEHEHQLEGHILVTDDLSPADTVLIQHQGIAAFVTESGGPTSHTAILARSLRIPAIVGMRHVQQYLHNMETVIIDGRSGQLFASPDNYTLHYYHLERKEEQRRYLEFIELKDRPAVTLDGNKISLQANVELPNDLEIFHDVGADGIGLYRTEYIFMNRSAPPDEEEQFEVYRDVVNKLKGKPLTLRTLDLGADKQVDGGRRDTPIATNPALGLRAIRLCLKDPSLFLPQVRAILRASAEGPVRMMIPMLSNTDELHKVLQLIRTAQQALAKKGQPFDPNLPIGGMIEVPAAAINALMFAQHLDFLSIGTNDLIQYTLAIDRVDDEVNYLYDPLNPAVIQLIAMTINAGKQSNTPVAMCGEMAGDPSYTRLLLGLGLCEFSMHPNALPEVKSIIMHSNSSKLRQLTDKLLHCTDHVRFTELIAAYNQPL